MIWPLGVVQMHDVLFLPGFQIHHLQMSDIEIIQVRHFIQRHFISAALDNKLFIYTAINRNKIKLK